MWDKASEAEHQTFIETWKDNPQQNRKAYLRLKDFLAGQDAIKLSFVARAGITYSLRAAHENQKKRELFVMVDVIDDVPEDRWLSVCFYNDMITDPEEKGDFVPEGLLGEDACCFDIEEWNDEDLSYVEARLAEAAQSASKEI